ncbi:MAG: hypothetical protein ACI9NT_002219 [Bacteroidia bacterium]|jgi:hypothetical protein
MLQIFAIGLVFVFTTMALQHLRYLHIRRVAAQDRQNPLHSIEVFHVIVLYQVNNGQRVVDAARDYVHKTDGTGAKLIYAGQAAFATTSEQLGRQSWNGTVLLQFSNRFVYEKHAVFLSHTADELFSDYYVHGMRRNRQQGLIMPQWLLRKRLVQLFKGQWQLPALVEQADYATSPRYDAWRHRVDRLRAVHKVNPDGLVVFNFIKRGSPQQRAAYESYGLYMLERMAALRHGPLHTGRSVALQGNARFDDLHIVHYPSAGYFADLMTSSFYHAILRDKQVGDTTWIPTIPFTDDV